MFVSAATHAEADTSKNRLPADWRRDHERLVLAPPQALQPDWDLTMVETDTAALEPSNELNNAGIVTGE
ncbi:hypothetical protein MJ561_13965 [Klebsiella pneumoniae]|nr:hypothetical protein MJ561_13965 [Klebsiella pneumoniae]